MSSCLLRVLSTGMIALAATALGCAKPAPPRVEPRAIRVTSVTPAQLGLAIELNVFNPNGYDLEIRSVEGKLTVADGVEIGTGRADLGSGVPAKMSTTITLNTAVNWTNMPALASLALSAQTIPYTFRGSANMGGDRLNVDVPFSLNGQLTREQVIQTGLNGLSKLPGLTGRIH